MVAHFCYLLFVLFILYMLVIANYICSGCYIRYIVYILMFIIACFVRNIQHLTASFLRCIIKQKNHLQERTVDFMLTKMADKREEKRERFVAHCDVCGRLMKKDESGWVEFQPKSRGTKAYICPECMRVHEYHEKQDRIRWGVNNGDTFTYGFEFEIIPKTRASHALLISRDYGMIATYDGSISPYGGIEFKTLVYDSLNGVKQIFRTIQENMVFSGYYYQNMGTHIHIGHGTRFTHDFHEWLYFNSYKLFDVLGEYLWKNPELCGRVFGRTLTGYANWPCDYNDHESFINVANFTNIEYRIPQFINATQYFHCVCLCKEFTRTLLDGYKKDVDPAKIGKKLVKLFIKHCNGEMNYQRPERNSK